MATVTLFKFFKRKYGLQGKEETSKEVESADRAVAKVLADSHLPN